MSLNGFLNVAKITLQFSTFYVPIKHKAYWNINNEWPWIKLDKGRQFKMAMLQIAALFWKK